MKKLLILAMVLTSFNSFAELQLGETKKTCECGKDVAVDDTQRNFTKVVAENPDKTLFDGNVVTSTPEKVN